jgi:hypothetical protein
MQLPVESNFTDSSLTTLSKLLELPAQQPCFQALRLKLPASPGQLLQRIDLLGGGRIQDLHLEVSFSRESCKSVLDHPFQLARSRNLHFLLHKCAGGPD